MANPEFILVRTDLTAKLQANRGVFGEAVGYQRSVSEFDPDFNWYNRTVRRPMRGIQIKQETFATLQVLGKTAVDLYNSSLASTHGFNYYTSNFILTGVTESRQEKFQPITTFGATYGFFFGEQPRMMSFQAVLLNTADFQWEIEWWANYEESLRGTRLVDSQTKCYLNYDDVVIEGYITGAQTSKNAATPYEVPLNFTMWVTGVEFISEPGDPNYPDTRTSNQVIDFAGADSFIENEVGDFVSTTAAVRSANLEKALAGPVGILGKLRATLKGVNDFVGQVGKAIDNAIALLYGRNLVIPAGFAGSELVSGQPVFVDASGNVVTAPFDPNDLSTIEGLLGGGGSLNLKVPANLAGQKDPEPRGEFWDNIDEYPVRAGGKFFNTRTRFGSDLYWDAVAFAGDPTTASNEDFDAMATDAAERAFADFGIKVTNIEGKANSELARALGRAAYAAINLAASASGASQAAASLTVGNVVGGGTL